MIKIEWRADFVSVLALLIAISSASITLYSYFIGPVISKFPPEEVTLIVQEYPDGQLYIDVAARMSYVNSGISSYKAIITSEKVSFNFKSQKFSHIWISESDVHSDGNDINIEYKRDAYPFHVSGGLSVSREVRFMPDLNICNGEEKTCDETNNYIEFIKFLNNLNDGDNIVFNFEATRYKTDEILSSKCSARIDLSTIDSLALNQWAILPCIPAS